MKCRPERDSCCVAKSSTLVPSLAGSSMICMCQPLSFEKIHVPSVNESGCSNANLPQITRVISMKQMQLRQENYPLLAPLRHAVRAQNGCNSVHCVDALLQCKACHLSSHCVRHMTHLRKRDVMSVVCDRVVITKHGKASMHGFMHTRTLSLSL